MVSEKVTQILNEMLSVEADELAGAGRYERSGGARRIVPGIMSVRVPKLKKVYEEIDGWRNCPLTQKNVYVFMDGVWHKRSWGGAVENVGVLVAIGVNAEGHREMIGVAEGMKEERASWQGFIQSLIKRGLKGVRLVVGERCARIVSTIASCCPKRAISAAWCTSSAMSSQISPIDR